MACDDGQKKWAVLSVVVVVLVLVISLVATSLKKLDTDEVGLAYDIHQKKLGDQVETAGLHNGAPGFKFIKFPSVFKSLDFGAVQCLNKEGIEIVLHVQLQYRARSKDLEGVILQFKDHDNYVKLLRSIAEAAIHDACSSFNTSQFQSQRAVFQELVRNTMAQRYGEVWADITDLQVANIERPAVYEKLIRDKEAAKENIKIAQNERPKELVQAKTTKAEAETQAQITLQKATSDATIMLLEAQAQVEQITLEYEAEKTSYKNFKDKFDVKTLLAYMGTRVIVEGNNSVNVAIDSPAKTNYA